VRAAAVGPQLRLSFVFAAHAQGRHSTVLAKTHAASATAATTVDRRYSFALQTIPGIPTCPYISVASVPRVGGGAG